MRTRCAGSAWPASPARSWPRAPQAALALEAAAARADFGIIILTEKVAAGIREQVDAIRLARDRPLIVEIPGPEGPVPGRKSLRQFVQEAVGIRVG